MSERDKSKNDTWSERELSRHLKQKGPAATKMNKTSPDTFGSYGSSKTQSKSRSSTSSKPKDKSLPSSSTSSDSNRALTQGSTSRRTAVREEKPKGNPPYTSGDTTGTRKTGQRKEDGASKERSREHERRDNAGRGGTHGRDMRGTGVTQSHVSKPPLGGRGHSDRQSYSSTLSSSSSEKSRISTERDNKKIARDDRKNERGNKKNERDKKSEHRREDIHSIREKEKKTESSEVKAQRSPDLRGAKGRHNTAPKPSHNKILVHENPPPKSRMVEEMDGGGEGGKSLQPMVEVMEEEYDYEEEEESYDEDLISDDDNSRHIESQNAQLAKPRVHIDKVDDQFELLALKQAMDAENELVGATSREQLPEGILAKVPSELSGFNDRGKTLPPSSSGRKFVDFSTAQKKDVDMKIAKRTKKRGRELLSLIEFDIVAYDMLDLSPLSEYEIYVKKFGSDDARQMAIQTGEDNMEAEIQTDSIASSDVWVQWPPEDLKGYGRKEEEEGDDDGYGSDGISGGLASRIKGQSAVRLISFLKKAGQVCSVLLEENLAASGVAHSHTTESQFPFCTSCMSIQNIPSNLFGWHVNYAHFSLSQDHLILASYSPPVSGVHPHAPQGVVCIWNSRDPVQPNIIMTCQAPVTCSCFSPQKASLAFAGGGDGSVILWDLREPLSMHRSIHRTEEFIGRPPTFSTAGIPQLANHQAPVVSISPVSVSSSYGGSKHRSSSSSSSSSVKLEVGDTIGLSFQLATLDRSGLLKLWVIVELASSESHGSDSDLGLAPGGRVKLVKSASVNLDPGPVGQSFRSIECHCLQFHPLDTNHIYVGTNTGCVHHHTRYGQRPIPHRYFPRGGSDPSSSGRDVGVVRGTCDVTSISFSLRQPNHFLVSCSDGSIRIHSTKRSSPLHSWPDTTEGIPVTTVKWVEHCPGVFLVLDASSHIYMWDLLENDSWPVFNMKLKSSVSFCTLASSSTSFTHVLLLAYLDGPMELHALKPLPQLPSTREKQLSEYLDNLF